MEKIEKNYFCDYCGELENVRSQLLSVKFGCTHRDMCAKCYSKTYEFLRTLRTIPEEIKIRPGNNYFVFKTINFLIRNFITE